MKEKFPAPKSADVPKILGQRAEKQQQLIGSIAFEGADDTLAAAVFLLENRRLVRDEGELQDLLGCSGKQVREARERASKALRADDTLGKYIAARVAETGEQAAAGATNPPEAVKENETIEEKLVRVAKKIFDVEAAGIKRSESKTRGKYATWATILIAQRSLQKTQDEAASLAGVTFDSMRNMRTTGRDEYAAQGFFYDRVRQICKELGVPAP